MTYKEEITLANTRLGYDAKIRYVGYGLKKGRAGGTIAHVADSQIIETTVAENLMVGLATGLSLAGLKPVVFIERMDFLLNALDALVNHLDKLERLSDGEFRPAAIIRCVVGNKAKPLYTGATHTQDFGEAVALMVSFPVLPLYKAETVAGAYAAAKESLDLGRSTMLIEYKDLL